MIHKRRSRWQLHLSYDPRETARLLPREPVRLRACPLTDRVRHTTASRSTIRCPPGSDDDGDPHTAHETGCDRRPCRVRRARVRPAGEADVHDPFDLGAAQRTHSVPARSRVSIVARLQGPEIAVTTII